MRKLQITEGEAYHEFNSMSEISINGHYTVKIGDVGVPFCVIPMPIGGIDTKQKALDKCRLVTDAINTANKCDMLPSELLEQRNELLKALGQIHFAYKTGGVKGLMKDEIEDMENIIDKIKNDNPQP